MRYLECEEGFSKFKEFVCHVYYGGQKPLDQCETFFCLPFFDQVVWQVEEVFGYNTQQYSIAHGS